MDLFSVYIKQAPPLSLHLCSIVLNQLLNLYDLVLRLCSTGYKPGYF